MTRRLKIGGLFGGADPNQAGGELTAVFSVTLPVFALIATGVLATRLQLLGPDATNVLNRFVVYLALPALLFDATARIRWVDIAHPGFFTAFGGGMALTFLAAAQFGRFSGARLADQSIQALGASFPTCWRISSSF